MWMLLLSSGITMTLNGFGVNENTTTEGLKQENMLDWHKNNYNRQTLLTATCDIELNLHAQLLQNRLEESHSSGWLVGPLEDVKCYMVSNVTVWYYISWVWHRRSERTLTHTPLSSNNPTASLSEFIKKHLTPPKLIPLSVFISLLRHTAAFLFESLQTLSSRPFARPGQRQWLSCRRWRRWCGGPGGGGGGLFCWVIWSA